MAAAARNPKYRRKQVTNGSLAYDLDWAVRERELSHAGEASRKKEKPKIRSIPKVLLRERESVSKLAVLSVAAIMGLAVLVLMNCVKLTLLSEETVELQSQLAELEEKHIDLTAKYQQMFDMASVKDAAEAAGMGKPSGTQMGRLDLSEGDSAVAYQEKKPNLFSRILMSLHSSVYTVVEYFD